MLCTLCSVMKWLLHCMRSECNRGCPADDPADYQWGLAGVNQSVGTSTSGTHRGFFRPSQHFLVSTCLWSAFRLSESSHEANCQCMNVPGGVWFPLGTHTQGDADTRDDAVFSLALQHLPSHHDINVRPRLGRCLGSYQDDTQADA